jgi:hypothetical protein
MVNKQPSLYCVTLLWLVPCLLGGQIPAKEEAGLKRVFGESAVFTRRTLTLDDRQIASVKAATGYAVGNSVTVYIASSKGTTVGYGIVDDVRGKSKLITYMLMVDVALSVKDLEVLVYREPYGGEIQYEAFRKQFRGKTPKDPIKVGNDIRNVSGATISTNAVTNGVRRLLGVLHELKNDGKI